MAKDNTLKKDAPKKETTPSEKVEKQIDIRKELTDEEAKRLIDLENNPEATEKAEEPTVEPKVEVPERYKGKSAEELVKLLDEKEKFIQSRSDEIGDWKQKVKEAEILSEKVAKIEEEAIKQSQQPSKLPKRPEELVKDDTYYEDPVKALNKQRKELLDYIDQLTSAKTAPFYQGDMERRREKLYKDLEDKYKDFPVKFDREKVQEFLNKNPEYFNQYKTKAYEQAYHDISAPDFGKTQKEEREKVREQVKKELIEEIKTNKQAGNIGLSDLETPPTGSAPEYDADRMEDDPEYRKQVLADMEKRERK